MSLYQIDQIKAATQSKGAYGPWKDNFVEMGRKTVIRRLAKYLPLSIEFQKATALDEMASSGRDQHLDDNTLDGDFIFAQPEPGADQTEEGAGAPQQLAYDPAPVLAQITSATNIDALDLVADGFRDAPDEHYDALKKAYDARRAALDSAA